MNLIGLFGNSTLLGGSSSASFSNFFPFFFYHLPEQHEEFFAGLENGTVGDWIWITSSKKRGKGQVYLASSCHPLHFFPLHIFSIFHLLFFKCKKPSWLHSYCHMCVLSFSSTSLLFSASLLFCFGSHIITPPIPLPSLAPHITLQLFLSASLPSLSFIHWLHLCSISYAALSPSQSSAHPLTG